ncbi:hypothetical protein J6590_082125 [Homalodisca vitripennis]|nr:hypothetical protein J6590_082125 [Homalodisca vitripennis]
MTTLVESGSTLKLSVAIREYEDNEEKRQPSAKLALIVPPRGRSSRTCSSRISTSMHTKATTPPHRQRVHANYRQRRTPIFYHSCKRISRQLDCTREATTPPFRQRATSQLKTGGTPIYCRSCKRISSQHDSTRR